MGADAVIVRANRRVTITRKGAQGPRGPAGPSGGGGGGVNDGSFALADYFEAGRVPGYTDDSGAMAALLADVAAQSIHGTARSGARIKLGPGKHYFATSINLHNPVYIEGAGSGQPYGAATIIRFGKNVDGFIINHSTTHGNGTGTQGDASGTVIEGLELWGGNVNVDTSGNVTTFAAADSLTGHGVRIRGSLVACKDVACYFWGGSGFAIVATAGSGGATEGNANQFYLERCQSQYNRGYGFEISGSDANAGTLNTCSAISNGGCGFVEYSFLGNTYIQCHARDNGNTDPTGSNGPVGVCIYGGASYVVANDQLAAASTTVPGTNSAIWIPAPYAGASRAWVTGQTWRIGGAYATNLGNVNARNVFMGCYAEGGQAPIQATATSMFVGGLVDEVGFAPNNSAGWITAASKAIISQGFRSLETSAGDFAFIGPQNGLTGNDTLLGWRTGGYIATLQPEYGGTLLLYGGGPAFSIDSPAATYGNAFRPRHLFLADGTGDRFAGARLCYGTAAPTTGAWTVGDIVFNKAPAAGGKIGWSCVAAGTPGSWKPFGAIDA